LIAIFAVLACHELSKLTGNYFCFFFILVLSPTVIDLSSTVTIDIILTPVTNGSLRCAEVFGDLKKSGDRISLIVARNGVPVLKDCQNGGTDKINPRTKSPS